MSSASPSLHRMTPSLTHGVERGAIVIRSFNSLGNKWDWSRHHPWRPPSNMVTVPTGVSMLRPSRYHGAAACGRCSKDVSGVSTTAIRRTPLLCSTSPSNTTHKLSVPSSPSSEYPGTASHFKYKCCSMTPRALCYLTFPSQAQLWQLPAPGFNHPKLPTVLHSPPILHFVQWHGSGMVFWESVFLLSSISALLWSSPCPWPLPQVEWINSSFVSLSLAHTCITVCVFYIAMHIYPFLPLNNILGRERLTYLCPQHMAEYLIHTKYSVLIYWGN